MSCEDILLQGSSFELCSLPGGTHDYFYVLTFPELGGFELLHGFSVIRDGNSLKNCVEA